MQGKKKMHTIFRQEHLKDRGRFEDLVVDRIIILKLGVD
jgi:hypothetical protein